MDKVLMKINNRGFWENSTAEGHGHDEGLAEALILFFNSEHMDTLIDMGCGDGYYVKRLRFNGISAAGVDGNPNTPLISNGLCKTVDLSREQNLGKFDWVLSLEVGEHIPQEFQKEFIGNLDRHNRQGIVLSWAVRGQGGDGHVNCLDNHEVISIFEDMRYKYDAEATQFLRDKCAIYPLTGWWFRNTIMCFRREQSECQFGYVFSEG
jgi:hypothetical protein